MASDTTTMLRRLATATAQLGAENSQFSELLAEVDDHLDGSLTSLDYCILYLERKLNRAAVTNSGCSLSLGMTEDILSHLKQKETRCHQHHQETPVECKSTSGSEAQSTSE